MNEYVTLVHFLYPFSIIPIVGESRLTNGFAWLLYLSRQPHEVGEYHPCLQ